MLPCYQYGKPRGSWPCQHRNQGWRWLGIVKWVSKKGCWSWMRLCFLRAHLNSECERCQVGMPGQKPAALCQDSLPLEGSVSPTSSFPGRFVQKIRKQTNTRSMLFLGDFAHRKRMLALIRALAHSSLLLRRSSAQVFAIAVSKEAVMLCHLL